MNLIEAIRNDIQLITTNTTDFNTEFELVSNGEEPVTVDVLGTIIKHNNTINPATGMVVNAETSRVMLSMLELNRLEYPYRNAAGHVSMIGHKVTYTDVNIERAYIVVENWPNDMMGIITLVLKYLKTA